MDATVSLESLWTFLQSLSLSDSKKEWLAEKLIESKENSPVPYTIEELDDRLLLAEEDFESGNTFTTDEVIADLQTYLK